MLWKNKVAALAIFVFLLIGCHPDSSGLRKQCAEAKTKGIEFLSANQQPNGQFPTFRWMTTSPGEKTSFDTPFTAAQVIYSLTFCEDARGCEIRERATQYLLSEQERPGVWRYLGKGGSYSPDVDDTALAWAALKRSGHPIPEEALDVVRASRNGAGLFNTWIGDPSTWFGLEKADKEIDGIVNVNALLFFGLASEKLDTVCNYVLTEIENGGFQRGTVYYSSPLAFTFAFSRAYAEGPVQCLQKGEAKIRAATLALQHENGGWGDDFETAAGLLTLINLGEKGEPVERGMRNLIARQTSDGGWALDAAYRGANVPVRFGSRALTTALSVEVLAKYISR